jgi:ligand-binding sensor domain-containing protein
LNIRPSTLIAFIAVAAVAVAAGYYAGTRQVAQSPQMESAPESLVNDTTQAQPVHPPIGDNLHGNAPADSATQMPGHPAVPATGQGLPPESGRAHLDAEVDPDAKFTHFRVGERNVKQILADGNIMWVGTSGGVIRYNIKTDDYRLYDNRSGLLANGVFHLSKLDDQLVVGTYGGGMSILDEATQSWKTYNIPQGLGDAFVYDVLEAENGDIWIATWSGANRVREGKLDDRASWDLYTVENTGGGLPNDWVYGLAMGKNGEVWMATEGGLARFKDGEWDNWNHENGQGADYELVKDQIQFANDPANYSKHHTRQKSEMGLEQVNVAYNPNYIVALLVDDDGSVWAGTWGGGLAHFDGKTWENFTMTDGLPANHVFSLHKDNDGNILVGTSNGLAVRDDNGSFRVFNTADGLYTNIVFSMATANDGSSWIGSFGGVARIAKLQ